MWSSSLRYIGIDGLGDDWVAEKGEVGHRIKRKAIWKLSSSIRPAPIGIEEAGSGI
jgi:hypothetical protein